MKRKTIYLDDNTRIRFGWHLMELGYSYVLQRRTQSGGWKRVAWTYHSSHSSFQDMKQYLLWAEKDKCRVPFYGEI